MYQEDALIIHILKMQRTGLGRTSCNFGKGYHGWKTYWVYLNNKQLVLWCFWIQCVIFGPKTPLKKIEIYSDSVGHKITGLPDIFSTSGAPLQYSSPHVCASFPAEPRQTPLPEWSSDGYRWHSTVEVHPHYAWIFSQKIRAEGLLQNFVALAGNTRDESLSVTSRLHGQNPRSRRENLW